MWPRLDILWSLQSNSPKNCQNIFLLVVTLELPIAQFHQYDTWVLFPLQSSIIWKMVFFTLFVILGDGLSISSVWPCDCISWSRIWNEIMKLSHHLVLQVCLTHFIWHNKSYLIWTLTSMKIISTLIEADLGSICMMNMCGFIISSTTKRPKWWKSFGRTLLDFCDHLAA